MTLTEYPDLIQGSDEWLAARCGILTASVVGQLITPKTIKVASNDGSRGLVATLAAERITGRVDPRWVSTDMQRGTDEEPWARSAYDENFAPVTEVGFMTEDKWGFAIGFSPDGIVGDDGLIEIKSRLSRVHVQIVLDGEVPLQHLAQIQTGLLVSGRKWCDYVDFSNGMHLFVKRVEADPAWFEAIIDAARQAEDGIREVIARYHVATINLPKTARIPELEEIRI
jgi:hypothetical protein